MMERGTDPSTGADDQVIPAAASDSWRTWLMTGVRRGPVSRRRVRGAHKSLKKILVEGMANGGDRPHPWKDFSGVMVRQAVDEAVNTLPAQQKQVVKLAYFTGLTNREIGEKLGLSVAGVEKRLRQALATVSDYVERGRATGRRAAFGLVMFLPGRLFGGTARRTSGSAIDHLMQAGMVAGAGAAAAALLALHPATPSQLTQIELGGTPPVKSVQSHAADQPGATVPQRSGVTSIAGSLSPVVPVGGTVLKAPGLPTLQIPIKVPPHTVKLSSLPSVPHLH
jgi:DNA-directed RNA polymerase specialized sigma24 family protein